MKCIKCHKTVEITNLYMIGKAVYCEKCWDKERTEILEKSENSEGYPTFEEQEEALAEKHIPQGKKLHRKRT